MTISSHRLRVEEKKVLRKLITSLGIFIVAIIILIYAGIPILTKTIVFLTSFRKENITTNTSESNLINPPVLDALAEATNSSTISVSGTADKEATVKISVNDTEAAKVLAGNDARFVAKSVRLKEGVNTIVATILAQDKESSPSMPLVITYQKNPPKLDITSPAEGQKFLAESKEVTISGETDSGNKITINDRFVIVDPDGKFDYKVGLTSGDNNFKITATDIAGNQTIIERKVNFTP